MMVDKRSISQQCFYDINLIENRCCYQRSSMRSILIYIDIRSLSDLLTRITIRIIATLSSMRSEK
eukprot:764287-Hanusia_phi.AAC.2